MFYMSPTMDSKDLFMQKITSIFNYRTTYVSLPSPDHNRLIIDDPDLNSWISGSRALPNGGKVTTTIIPVVNPNAKKHLPEWQT